MDLDKIWAIEGTFCQISNRTYRGQDTQGGVYLARFAEGQIYSRGKCWLYKCSKLRRDMDVLGPDVRECFRLYGQYKICPDSTCIHANDTCPCLVSDDFQCLDEYCIPRFYWCDGIPDCSEAEDEIDCPNSSTEAMQTGSGSGISMAAVVTISTLCVLFCVAVAAMFVIFVARRTGRHKSGESKSATEPLRKCYISESSDSRDDSDRLPVRAKTYYRKCDSTEEIERDYSIYKPVPKRNGFFTTQNGNHPASSVSRNNSDDKDIQNANLAIGENAEIYDLDRNEISPKITGLGKYTFKPRLKY
ncbi:hypothetical protein MAR_026601, partial [Mya arenaria]